MTELRYGYTLADLHALARLAVHTVGQMGMDWHERYDLAYSAMAEHLYAAADAPRRHQLVTAGQRAVYAVVTAHQHHHGYYRAKTHGAAHGPGSSPAFARYWYAAGAPWEERIIDDLTARAIMPRLTPRQREAVAALAATGDYQAAAAALGVKANSFVTLLGRGRREFYALWHQGERPSRPWRLDKRVARRPVSPTTEETLTP